MLSKTFMPKRLGLLLLLSTLLLPACRIIPKAQGLPSWPQLQQQPASSQQQAEIIWQQKSFSFLLYQARQADYLQLIALSVTGQILFELHYDGHKLKVIQRIAAMKYLPFDYLLRDIMWASLPASTVQQQIQPLGLQLQQESQDGQQIRQIWQQQQLILEVHQPVGQSAASLEIDNKQAKYRLLLSPASAQFFLQ